MARIHFKINMNRDKHNPQPETYLHIDRRVSMIKRIQPNSNAADQLETIAARAYSVIAEKFPVCAVSDEFYFFPMFDKGKLFLEIWFQNAANFSLAGVLFL